MDALTASSSNSMSMTGHSTRRDDGIDASKLDSTTAHTPKGIDIAKGQAEKDCQQHMLEVCHLCDLTEPWKEMPKPKEEEKYRASMV